MQMRRTLFSLYEYAVFIFLVWRKSPGKMFNETGVIFICMTRILQNMLWSKAVVREIYSA